MPFRGGAQVVAQDVVYGALGGVALLLMTLLLCMKLKSKKIKPVASVHAAISKAPPTDPQQLQGLLNDRQSLSFRTSLNQDDETTGTTVDNTQTTQVELEPDSVLGPSTPPQFAPPDLVKEEPYASVTGLSLNIPPVLPGTADSDLASPLVRRGSGRGSVKKPKKDPGLSHAAAPASAPAGPSLSCEMEYASVSNVFPGDMPEKTEGFSIKTKGSQKSNGRRNSQRGRHPSLPSTPKADKDELHQRKGSQKSRLGPRVSIKDHQNLAIVDTGPSSAYASLSNVQSLDTDAPTVSGDLDGHYAAVIVSGVGTGDTGGGSGANSLSQQQRLHKSYSMGAYARVDVTLPGSSRNVSQRDTDAADPPADHEEMRRQLTVLPGKDPGYSRPKKISMSMDLADTDNYAQPTKNPLRGQLSCPGKNALSVTERHLASSLAPRRQTVPAEGDYAVPRITCESKRSLAVESPYASPALPVKTSDALSLVSSDCLIHRTDSSATEDADVTV